MANKTRIEFEGFEEAVARLSKLEGNVRQVTEKALDETHKYVTNQVQPIIRKHKQTGATEASLKTNSKVEWAGTLASDEVGFNIRKGGLPSIFLMYGTPRMKKDQKLYDAFYGSKTRNQIMKIQEDIFYAEIRRLDS